MVKPQLKATAHELQFAHTALSGTDGMIAAYARRCTTCQHRTDHLVEAFRSLVMHAPVNTLA